MVGLDPYPYVCVCLKMVHTQTKNGSLDIENDDKPLGLGVSHLFAKLVGLT